VLAAVVSGQEILDLDPAIARIIPVDISDRPRFSNARRPRSRRFAARGGAERMMHRHSPDRPRGNPSMANFVGDTARRRRATKCPPDGGWIFEWADWIGG